MKTKKLSKVQQDTLSKMKYNIWYCAYELGVSMATLNALRRMDLVERRADVGAFRRYPRAAVKFKKEVGTKMTTDFPNIKPNNHYRRLSNDNVFTGQQILNLLELAEPVMQAIILFDIKESDEPVNRLGEYGTVLAREQK